MQAEERMEVAKLAQQAQIVALANQLDQFKVALQQGETAQRLQLDHQKLQASILEAQEKLAAQRDELMLEMQKIAGDQELKQVQLLIEQQTAPFEQQLEAQRQQIDLYELELRKIDQSIKMQERQMIDTHTTTDNILQEMRLQIDAAKIAAEAQKQPELPPITINMPQPSKTTKKIKVQRDEMGNIVSLEGKDVEEPSV